MKYGTLYGIGVGPGDPDLITLKAVKVLGRVAVVFASASTKNRYSLSVDIVSPHLKKDIPLIRLDFPMTRDRAVLQSAWERNAVKVKNVLETGQDAALLTLGDPMTYSTFGYLMRTLKASVPDIPIEVIPGITSYQAGCASSHQVLAEGEESFTVVSGALGAGKLKQVIEHTDNVVMIKVYRNYKEIMETLHHLDLISKAVLVSRCGLDGQEIISNLKDQPGVTPPYLSHLIIKKNHSS